jgi:hypothetical protein
MPLKKPTGEEIYEFRKKNPSFSWVDVSKHYEISSSAAKKREQRYRNKNNAPALGIRPIEAEDTPPKADTHKVKFTEKEHSATAYSISKRIKSLDQLLKACNADLTKWRVAKHIVNVWEGGRKSKVVDLTWKKGVMDGFVEDSGDWQLTDLWQVKAWFEPREEEPYEKALEDLIEKVRKHVPKYKPSGFTYKPIIDGYLLIPNLYDAHFGKRSHRNFNYTLDEARDDFIKIAKAVAAQVLLGPKKVSRIMFPVGNDLLHVDSLLEKTTNGTWVETSEDLRIAIDAACEATAETIEIFATVAPVDVIPVEGNHDRLQTYWLGKYLQAVFSHHPNVNVYDMKLERQYYQWGKVGIGLAHDGKSPQQLATLFPVEARKMWADIKWSEWLTGHFHHQRGALYAVDSIRGTVVRTISALCNMDNYHSLHLYVGTHRAADVLYYHKENGPAGSFPVFVSEL